MKITTTSTLAAAALVACAALAPVRADHIPGHNEGDPVFPVPIPGQEHFSGGAMLVTAIGPVAGDEIVNTRFDVTFVSDGATPASNLLLNVGLWVEDGEGGATYVETIVTGEDLGFGSGAGTFHGEFETLALNSIPVESFFFPPHSVIDIVVDATTGGGIQGTGYFVDSFIYFDLDTGEGCAADVDRNGGVDVDDLIAVILAWGKCENPDDCPADVDGSQVVDVDDLVAVILAMGGC